MDRVAPLRALAPDVATTTNDGAPSVRDEATLASLCCTLLPAHPSLSSAEQNLPGVSSRATVHAGVTDDIAAAVRRGADPLGECLLKLRTAESRRLLGAVYTPPAIVAPLLTWLKQQGAVQRFVDPGAGSGRFVLAAGDAFPQGQLLAVESDPLAALVLRANLHLRGMAARSEVIVDDYRRLRLPRIEGRTAFVGNPPYVRHHHIGARWKRWYTDHFARLGITASAMAGLHLHFFLKTALLARDRDIGAFVTSAEWLDVNYGAALRRLLVQRLGAVGLHVLAPQVEAFTGTATTTAITCFRVTEVDSPITVRSVSATAELAVMSGGVALKREVLLATPRWTSLLHPARAGEDATLALGDLFRVLRGQVTGANAVWIYDDDRPLLPPGVLRPTITRAQELIRAGTRLQSAEALRQVVDLPTSLDEFNDEDMRRIDDYLVWARQQGAHTGYIARNRKAWWAVALREPAPILCTYMARRAPQFTLNLAGARHINVAHGLYPRQAMADEQLDRIVSWLNANVDVSSGRTYAWGLTKFEPKEIARLRIPAHLAEPR